MSFFSSSRALYLARVVQLAFTTGFLIIVSDAGAHRGWWNNINGPLAVGIITSILTLVLTIYTIIIQHSTSTNPFTGSTTRTILRVGCEIVFLLLWIATAVLMLRSHGCNIKGKDVEGQVRCYKSESDEQGIAWSDQPSARWNIGVAFGFVEIVSFLVTSLLVFREERANKVGGGASYA